MSLCREGFAGSQYLTRGIRMETTERPVGQVTRRPFHETIVDAIKRAHVIELQPLALLIVDTKIPKNHDAILAAWEQRLKEVGWDPKDTSVPAVLLEQKQEAAEEAKAKERAGDTPA